MNYLLLNQQGLGDVIMSFPLMVGINKRLKHQDKLYIIVQNQAAIDVINSRFPENKYIYIKWETNVDRLMRYKCFFKTAIYFRDLNIDVLITYGFFVNSISKAIWSIVVNPKRIVTALSYKWLNVFSSVEYVDNQTKLLHKSDYANKFLLKMGLAEENEKTEYPLKEIDINQFGIKNEDNIYIAVVANCATVRNVRLWNEKNYMELFARLKDMYIHPIFVFFANGENEIRYVRSLMVNLKKNDYIECFNTTIEESRNVFNKMDIVFGVDSGGLHLASTVSKPEIIGIYAASNPNMSGIRREKFHAITADIKCAPCIDSRKKISPALYCDNYECMSSITVDKVIDCFRGIKIEVGK